MTTAQLDELTAARARMKRLRWAAGYAAFDGTIIAVFAGITLVAGFPSVSGLLMGGLMAVVAWIEFRGRSLLTKLEERGGRMVAWNQVAFAGLIAAYAGWCIACELWGERLIPRVLAEAGDQWPPETIQMLDHLKDLDELYPHLVAWLYALVGGVAVIPLGLTSWYYFSCARLVQAHLALTPQWILDAESPVNNRRS
jgi:hypothetical protein